MNSAIQTETLSSPSLPQRKPTVWTCFVVLALIGLAIFTVLIAGYHPGAEDDGVYLPAIERNLNPHLFPKDADFFALQMQATVFDKAIAALVRISHLSVAQVALAVHLLSILGLLTACYQIASRCFESPYARWCGVALVGVFSTLPVSGTALYIIDQNLHPRAIATMLILFALNFAMQKRYALLVLMQCFAFAFHPLMSVFGLSLCVFVLLPWPLSTKMGASRPSAAHWAAVPLLAIFAVPMGWIFEPPSAAWRIASDTRSFYFLWRWEWYEWLGVIAPIFILLWFGVMARRAERPQLSLLSNRVAAYGSFQLAVSLVLLLPTALERFRPMQPMRYLHILYLLMVLLGGCYIGDKILRNVVWRWTLLFLPATIGMFLAQRAIFPATPHLELPGMHASNPWLKSFEWIRANTPEDAYFALGADYLDRPKEDCHGFRALALRSALADSVKDTAVVTQVPRLAERWLREVEAQSPASDISHHDWQNITTSDLARMKAQFGVNWVVLERPNKLALNCPYHNELVEVCRI